MIHWVGWRKGPGTHSFFRRGHGLNLQLKLDIERVNIRPRKFDCIGLINFDRSNMVKGKKNKNLL